MVVCLRIAFFFFFWLLVYCLEVGVPMLHITYYEVRLVGTGGGVEAN